MLELFLSKFRSNQYLNELESYQMQNLILQNKALTKDILAIFESLELRRKTTKKFLSQEELNGIVKASQENMLQISTEQPTMDVVGTGGDKLDTFNISTLTALVLASCGQNIAKHGNRSSTSKCGSADILESFGVKIDLTAQEAKNCLEETGFVFCFAKNFNPGFKFVAKARKEFAKKTYFNFLGPLLNPTRPKFALIGLNDFSMSDIMLNCLVNNNLQKAWIVQSEDGMDEISTTSTTKVLEIENDLANPQKNNYKKFEIDATKFNLKKSDLKDIQIKDFEESKKVFLNILENQATKSQTEIVLLNSSASLLICGKVKNLQDGIILAKENIESGKVKQKFEQILKFFS
jgi:anthranilate phosphoribosyltransferase